MNLHLYIRGGSAHPEGTLKGTSIGNLQRYWKQNTKEEAFVHIASKVATPLTNRGHEISIIAVIFKQAGSNTKRVRTPNNQQRPGYRATILPHSIPSQGF
jgi:hypothetical protein